MTGQVSARTLAAYIFALAASLSGCTLYDSLFDPPGKGELAERGYAICAPLIAALEKHRTEHQVYVASLTELTPTYLSALPNEDIKSMHVAYFTGGTNYELSFSYAGPGMNKCTYRSEKQAWSCMGYY